MLGKTIHWKERGGGNYLCSSQHQLPGAYNNKQAFSLCFTLSLFHSLSLSLSRPLYLYISHCLSVSSSLFLPFSFCLCLSLSLYPPHPSLSLQLFKPSRLWQIQPVCIHLFLALSFSSPRPNSTLSPSLCLGLPPLLVPSISYTYASLPDDSLFHSFHTPPTLAFIMEMISAP